MGFGESPADSDLVTCHLSLPSKHYPVYSLNVASMWLKLGRLYMGLENKAAGEKALKKAIAIMEVAHGKDHPYISEIKQEIESH